MINSRQLFISPVLPNVFKIHRFSLGIKNDVDPHAYMVPRPHSPVRVSWEIMKEADQILSIVKNTDPLTQFEVKKIPQRVRLLHEGL